ncbi:MAG: FAD-dependent oxidoreductase [Dehalococcoidia bacterium]
MSDKTVLVLGGGIGGLTAATHLRRLAPEHRVVLIERSATFAACMSHLWVMTGERADVSEGERELAALSTKDIEVVQAEITACRADRRALRRYDGAGRRRSRA